MNIEQGMLNIEVKRTSQFKIQYSSFITRFKNIHNMRLAVVDTTLTTDSTLTFIALIATI
ncbi:MAG: hypothetical protein AB1546_03535 [bacterium]